jgi:hypothetical protein
MQSSQHPLTNFYNKVKTHSPILGVLISEDVVLLALGALTDEHEPVQESVDRLREMTNMMPEDIRIIREDALAKLGYL